MSDRPFAPTGRVAPHIEMWSSNGPLTPRALAELIEASNAYALCEFKDPVNQIYVDMLMKAAAYLPQLLAIAANAREVATFTAAEKCQECGVGRNPEWRQLRALLGTD